MKVYIGWSGDASGKIASILNSCLPLINDSIETLVSDNIAHGASWQVSLSQAIRACDAALLCVTSENIQSPWLYYEAGAMLGKTVFVILFDVSRSQLSVLLGQFPSIALTKDNEQTKESMRALSYELNELCKEDGHALSMDMLDARFEALYPTIEKMLAEVRKAQESDELKRAREYYERAIALSQQIKAPKIAEEYLQQDFRTLNSKLDAILSQLSKVSPGNVDGKAE